MRILLVLCVACAFATGQDLDYGKDSEESDGYEDDAKDNYFRYVRAYEGGGVVDDGDGGEVPRPGGFRLLRERRRRDVDKELEKLAEDELGKPLELEELEAENSTEMNYGGGAKNDIVINDFIRFKREAEEVTEKTDKSGDEKVVDVDVDMARPKREHDRSGKMLLSTGQPLPEGSREPRGATKEQWIKQPYPVQTTNPHRNYDDNVPSPSETARAPRVHFVTQRRSESAPPLVYHSYDREGRSRDLNRQVSADRDANRDMEQGYYPRPPRHYNPQTPSQNYPYRPDRQERPDPYYRDERDRRQEYDYPNNRYDEERPSSSFGKQRRIIYYATLPEVVRTPPNADSRDRFNYRERYDNRYVTSPPLSVGTGSGENYRFRNGNPYSKSRYDEASKTAYPTKVSTDVNVREVKKNPERRIYSEADRRYAYKVPNYHHDDGSYDRN